MGDFLELDEVKAYFNLDDDDLDDLLQFLIEHYSEVIIDATGVSEINIKTKQALLFAVGCHLQRTNPDKISPTIAYTIGEVKERFQAQSTVEASWCRAFDDKIAEIKAEQEGKFVAVGIRRKGLSNEY